MFPKRISGKWLPRPFTVLVMLAPAKNTCCLLSCVIFRQFLSNHTYAWNVRQDFAAYARRAVRRLAKNMEQTSSSLQSSKWLAGARVVYEAVRTRRSAIGKDTKSFADWINLQHYSTAIDIGMSSTSVC